MKHLYKTLFHSKFATTALAAAALAVVHLTPVMAAGGHGPEMKKMDWSFEGIFGTYDRGSLQRGYQVYKEVCSSCHSLSLLSYRNLSQAGGPQFTPEQVKVLAAESEVTDGPNDEGEMFQRPGRASDKFVSPFPNDEAARASNGGALPPDLSLIVKARKNGANYIYSLMTGYEETPPAGTKVREGMNFNPYYPGHQIAMAAPLSEESVEYTDGTKPTLENHAKDVVTFLAWAAEPNMEQRKAMGFKVIIYLLILAGLLYLTNKKMWARIKK